MLISALRPQGSGAGTEFEVHTMQWISDSNILIVGLGLIGGSYARALHRLGYHISAITRRQSSIDYALAENIIDEGFDHVEETCVRNADAVIFALYPGVFLDWINTYQHLLKPGALLTDVTGVKGCIVYDVQAALRPDVEFIAAHPMAGREVYGVENSDDRIFKEANFIVTPTEKNTPEAVAWCKSLGRVLGFRKVSVLSPEEHDEMIGFLSQLTHCIAVALMTCSDNRHLVDYTGDSFRDLTRIANINENMWPELFMLNKEELLSQMELFESEFNRLKEAIAAGDETTIKEMMITSTERRQLFNKK